MQAASDAYIKSMKHPKRNRGYIKGTIGIINSEAQNNAVTDEKENKFTYFSNTKKPFENFSVDMVYATCEQDFSKVDGTMYFLPKQNAGYEYYNNGIVTDNLIGVIYITFNGSRSLDIKGMTIDFGEYYPSELSLENDNIKYTYKNNKRLFVTEDVFDGTSFIVIRAIKMINGQGRLRVNKINFGIVDTFSNKELLSFTMTEYVSPTTETIPSKDVEIVLDNQNFYYNPDNPNSALAYLEIGQQVKVAFGYDVNDDGKIEWLPEMLTFLKGWNATDTEAQFTCTDLFYTMEDTYYKGVYRKNGITLYDLALDVFNDSQIDKGRYFIDPYLRNITVYNPLPPVKHSEALQIIANAGRCSLYDDREGRIHLQASFIPDMKILSNGETEYSKSQNILNDDSEKDAYAVCSNDFSTVNGTVIFMPKNKNYLHTGYVSESMWMIPDKGSISSRFSFRFGSTDKYLITDGYWDQGVPILTVLLESGFVAYGFKISFRNVYPEEFIIHTYYQGSEVEAIMVRPTGLVFETHKRFELFDKLTVEFTKGYPNSRVFVDAVWIGDVTDYNLTRTHDIESSPMAVRQKKLRVMNIIRNIYNDAQKDVSDIQTEEIEVSPSNAEHTVYFSDPSYELSAMVEENPNIDVEIIESSNYFAKLKFSGMKSNTKVRVKIEGKTFYLKEDKYSNTHNDNGKDIDWNNPLVSTIEHAKDLEEWISSYYIGDVEYEINWRGDPRVDANDVFYLHLKDGQKRMIRAFENNLSFDGAWSGILKARAVSL